tara:strand:+ start:176 stop:1600 length:1425 start_codon:yes stop_codon:yes gene_type:complete
MADRLVPFSTKLAFGTGQVAEGIKTTSFSLFVLFYYNQVLGLSGSLTGAALFIALVVDAVTDPLVGSMSDNLKSKLGRRHPFMYAAAIPLGLAFIGMFSPPGDLSEIQLFLWLVVFSVLTRVAMTFYQVPHLALGAELTDNFHERTRVVSYRQFFGTIGGALASIIGFGYYFSDEQGGRLVAENYTAFGVTLSLMMVVAIWYSAWGTQSEIPFLKNPTPDQTAKGQFFSTLKQVFQNSSFRSLFTGVLVICVMAGVNLSLDLYMYQYFWEFSARQMMFVQFGSIFGLLGGTLIAGKLHELAGKRFSIALGATVWAALQVLPVVLRLFGWFPENSTQDLFVSFIAIKFIQGLLLQQVFVSLGSMMADVADEHEYLFFTRREGIYFGAIAFSTKATTGLGNFIGGVGLDVIGWPSGSDMGVPADIPTEVILNLGLLYGPFVAAFSVIAVWCFSKYSLTESRHKQILDELYVRRESV